MNIPSPTFAIDADRIFDGILWYVVFLFSMTFHEAAHGFVSMKLGDRTAYEGGQVTLDPIPHVRREPIGTVLVPIISYIFGGWMIGWASAPFNVEWSARYPKRAALMALAGPLANLLLASCAFFLIKAGIWLHILLPPETISFIRVAVPATEGFFSSVVKCVSIGFSLNLLLFVFNLLPLPPLDGSGIVPLLLPAYHARRYAAFTKRGAFALVGLFLSWKLVGYIFPWVHLFCINLLYPGVHYH